MIRAAILNRWRRLFPHPAAVARADRARAARAGKQSAEEAWREKRDAMTARLRAEVEGRA